MFLRKKHDDEYLTKELIDIYTDFVSLLRHELKLATAQQKPLLILAGESHRQTHSLATQLMLLLAMKEVGINSLIVEFSPRNTGHILLNKHVNRHYNAVHSIPFAKHTLGFNIIPADVDRKATQIKASDHQAREAHMQRICETAVQDSAGFIVGSNHMQSLHGALKDKFHVSMINLSRYVTAEVIAYSSMAFIEPVFMKSMLQNTRNYAFITKKALVKQTKKALTSKDLEKRKILSLALQIHRGQIDAAKPRLSLRGS